MSRTILNEVPALLSGESWPATKAPRLSYSFPDSRDDYGYSGFQNVKAGYAPVTSSLAESLRAGLQSFADVSGLGLTELTGAQDVDADLKFARSTAPETAFSYYPSLLEQGGDAWFNTTAFNSPVTGGYAWSTILHELGHSFGLKHAHEKEAKNDAVVNVNYDSHEFTLMTYHSFVGAGEFFGNREPLYTNGRGSGPQSLMMLDIAGLQDLYGANFAFRSGDTVYRFAPSTGRMEVDGALQEEVKANIVFRTIWDGGGRDTYDFRAYTRALDINLNPGGWVDLDVNGNNQRAHLGGSSYARGHVFNALQYGSNVASLIENAIGGAAGDSLRGNRAANLLDGRGGNDTLEGLGGNDTLIGGGGADAFIFNMASSRSGGQNVLGDLSFGRGDTIILRGLDTGVLSDGFLSGNRLDVLDHGAGAVIDSLADINEISRSDRVDAVRTQDGKVAIALQLDDAGQVLEIQLASTGWASLTAAHGYLANAPEFGTVNDVLKANGAPLFGGIGDDTMTGTAGRDTMNGGSGEDVMSGGRGGDKLSGGGGNDTIAGGGGNDTLKGGGGSDMMKGGGGRDLLVGGASGDSLHGGNGNDALRGKGGADRLEGAGGNDVLKGGGGKDRFIFHARDGVDTIVDFRQGQDKIVIESGASRFGQLSISDAGDHVLIEFAHTTIKVEGSDADHFKANDFLF